MKDKLVYYLTFFAFIMNGCNSSKDEIRKVYYDNGKLKAELILTSTGIRNGYCKFYYLNGNLSYEGEFKKGLRVGKHLDYFENLEGKVQYEITYEIESGKEKPIKKIIYDENGLATYESNLAYREIEIQKLSTLEFVGDTLKIKITILNPQYDYTDAFIGNFDKNLNPLDTIPSQHFGGTPNHEAIVSIPIKKSGLNEIKGFIRDFDIKPVNDTLGVTVAYDTYFEYRFTVKERTML